MIIFVIIVMVILHAPLFGIHRPAGAMPVSRPVGFWALIWPHDHEFDEKWIKNSGKKGRARACWAVATSPRWVRLHVRLNTSTSMFLIPFDKKASMVLVLAALLADGPAPGDFRPAGGYSQGTGEVFGLRGNGVSGFGDGTASPSGKSEGGSFEWEA